jgi:hypothetical protein
LLRLGAVEVKSSVAADAEEASAAADACEADLPRVRLHSKRLPAFSACGRFGAEDNDGPATAEKFCDFLKRGGETPSVWS